MTECMVERSNLEVDVFRRRVSASIIKNKHIFRKNYRMCDSTRTPRLQYTLESISIAMSWKHVTS